MIVGPATGAQNSAYSLASFHFSSDEVRTLNRLTLPPIALAAVASACLMRHAAPAPAPPLAVQLAPGAETYSVVEQRRVTQEFHGQPMVSEARTETTLAVTLDSTDSDLSLSAVVESVSVQGDAGLPPEAVAQAKGAQIFAAVARTGHLTGITSPDSGNAIVGRLLLQLPDLLPRLPAGGATPNTTWSDTTETHGRTAGLPLTVRTQTTHHTESWIEREGQHLMPITSQATYEVSGEGRPDGQWIEITGQGRRVTLRLLTPDGRIAQAIASDTLDAKLSLPDAGTVIPVMQTAVDSVRVVQQ
jgi:hypothetical protein